MHDQDSIPTTDRRSTVDRTAILRASIRRAEAELAALEAVPDPAGMVEGTVLRWVRVYPPGQAARRGLYTPGDPFTETAYTFVALKMAGRWYSTAQGSDLLSDAELREVLADESVSKIEVASWTPIADSTEHLAIEPVEASPAAES
jgi:hypothetical protein